MKKIEPIIKQLINGKSWDWKAFSYYQYKSGIRFVIPEEEIEQFEKWAGERKNMLHKHHWSAETQL